MSQHLARFGAVADSPGVVRDRPGQCRSRIGPGRAHRTRGLDAAGTAQPCRALSPGSVGSGRQGRPASGLQRVRRGPNFGHFQSRTQPACGTTPRCGPEAAAAPLQHTDRPRGRPGAAPIAAAYVSRAIIPSRLLRKGTWSSMRREAVETRAGIHGQVPCPACFGGPAFRVLPGVAGLRQQPVASESRAHSGRQPTCARPPARNETVSRPPSARWRNVMETTVAGIAQDIYRSSTFVSWPGLGVQPVPLRPS